MFNGTVHTDSASIPVKTIFLCQYLHSEALRREIQDGLNVVEQWNGATDFVFFARRGEMVSDRREDHEISMLALHSYDAIVSAAAEAAWR